MGVITDDVFTQLMYLFNLCKKNIKLISPSNCYHSALSENDVGGMDMPLSTDISIPPFIYFLQRQADRIK